MADVLDIENSEEFEVDEDGERMYFLFLFIIFKPFTKSCDI